MTTPLRYSYSYGCTTPHYIQQLWVWWPTRWPLQPLQPVQKHNSNHLSVHQWIRSAIRDSQQPTSPIGFLFLKLSPPPCAALLVHVYIYIYTQNEYTHRHSQWYFPLLIIYISCCVATVSSQYGNDKRHRIDLPQQAPWFLVPAMMIALRCRKAAALIMALVLLRAATGSVACPQAPWPPQTLPCGKTLGKRCKRQLFIVATVVRLRMLIGSNQLVWLMVLKEPPTRPFWVAKHQVSARSSHKCPEPMFCLQNNWVILKRTHWHNP